MLNNQNSDSPLPKLNTNGSPSSKKQKKSPLSNQPAKKSFLEFFNIDEHEEYVLKLGSTFDEENTAKPFNTIRYDFKPECVDEKLSPTVDFGSNNGVTVTVPNLVGSTEPHTTYKGSKSNYSNDCLLIYDEQTGEFTLEKLTDNINVKLTRNEKINKSNVPSTSKMPLTSTKPANDKPKAGAIKNTDISLPSKMALASSSSSTRPAANLEHFIGRKNSRTRIPTGRGRDSKEGNSRLIELPSKYTRHLSNNGKANKSQASLPMIVEDEVQLNQSTSNHERSQKHRQSSSLNTGQQLVQNQKQAKEQKQIQHHRPLASSAILASGAAAIEQNIAGGLNLSSSSSSSSRNDLNLSASSSDDD